MAGDTRATKVRTDADGVRTVATPGVRRSVWLLALAMGLISLAGLLLVGPTPPGASDDTAARAQRPRPPAARSETRGRPDTAGAAPDRPAKRWHPVPLERKAGPAGAEPSAGEPAVAADAPAAGGDAGDEPSGIALFPPPGTNPPKPGIIVPDDFELPPGFVRHYQATDDGQRLPAILMFHPDYQWVDEHGEALTLPEDHVVPPEMAPAGLPIEMLEVPDRPVPMVERREDQGAQDSAP